MSVFEEAKAEMARLRAEDRGWHLRDDSEPVVRPDTNPRAAMDAYCICGELTRGGLCWRCEDLDAGRLA